MDEVKGNRVRIPSDPVTVFGELTAGRETSQAIAGRMPVRRRGARGSVSQETCLTGTMGYLPRKVTRLTVGEGIPDPKQTPAF